MESIKLSNVSKVEVITNGDVLSSKRLQELYISDVSKVLVSMYDGPEQIEKFKKMTKKANVPEDLIILRDRWYDKYNDFGVKLTNRAGTIKTGIQEEVGLYKNCYYPSYQFLIDWNGNVYLCPQVINTLMVQINIPKIRELHQYVIRCLQRHLYVPGRNRNPANLFDSIWPSSTL